MARPEVGRIGRAHGLKGEVQITSAVGVDHAFATGEVLEGDGRDWVVATARRHQGRWLVRFDGVDDRTTAEQIRGVVLTAEPSDDAGPTNRALIARVVVGIDGVAHGTVVDVLPNPAHELLLLDDDTLVPVVFVVDRSDPTRVVVDAPEGIFE